MDDQFRLYHVAKLYYIDRLKQAEIAEMMHLSVMTVSRLLKSAEETGLVSVEIHSPENLDHEMSRALKEKYPALKESLVLSPRAGERARIQLAALAASYVQDLLTDRAVLGISWGKTISTFASQLRPTRAQDVQVIQLSGGFLYENNYLMMPSNIVQTASDKLRCQALYLNMPMFISNLETKRQLLQDPLNRYALDKAQQCQINVVGLSNLSESPTMQKVGVLTAEDMEELKSVGAIGDIVGYFINDQGEPVQWSKSKLYGGADLATISAARYVICLAMEAEKARVTHLALRKKYVNTLIITRELARELLKQED